LLRDLNVSFRADAFRGRNALSRLLQQMLYWPVRMVQRSLWLLVCAPEEEVRFSKKLFGSTYASFRQQYFVVPPTHGIWRVLGVKGLSPSQGGDPVQQTESELPGAQQYHLPVSVSLLHMFGGSQP
jgi:hypothetical protein